MYLQYKYVNIGAFILIVGGSFSELGFVPPIFFTSDFEYLAKMSLIIFNCEINLTGGKNHLPYKMKQNLFNLFC